MKTKFHYLILTSTALFCSFSSLAQDQAKCSITFKSVRAFVGGVTVEETAPELQKLLESKGYSATLVQNENEWRYVSGSPGISKFYDSEKASKLNGSIYLRFDGTCTEKAGSFFSFGAGNKKKWECGPASNKAVLYSASGDQLLTNYYELGSYDKVFSSEIEGKKYIISELAKQLPTCDVLRLKLPLTMLSKITEKNEKDSTLAPIDVNDSSKIMIKQKQESDESINTGTNSISK